MLVGMQMPFLRHSEEGSTVSWLKMYWHTGAQAVKVHLRLVFLGYTCASAHSPLSNTSHAGSTGQQVLGLSRAPTPRHRPCHQPGKEKV